MFELTSLNLKFKTLDDLKFFIESEEKELFKFLKLLSGQGGILTRNREKFYSVINLVNMLKNTPSVSDSEITNLKSELLALNALYLDNKLIYSKSPFYIQLNIYKQILDLSDNDINGVLFVYVNEARIDDLIRSNMLYTKYYMLFTNIKSDLDKSKKVKGGDWTKGINDTVAELNDRLSNVNEELSNSVELRDNLKKDIETIKIDHSDGVNSFKEKSQQSLDQFEKMKKDLLDSIKAEFSLNDSITYSDGEETISFKKFGLFLFLSCLVLTAGFLLVACFLVMIAFLKYPYGGEIKGFFVEFNYSLTQYLQKTNYLSIDVVLYAVILLLFIWLARILMKVAINNYNRSVNYKERKILMQSYISMISAGHITNPEEKNVALISIFKNISSGIDGDSHPHPLMELADLVKKKGQ